MSRFAVAFLLVTAITLAATPALAQGSTQFILNTISEGGGGYFRIEGSTARNPNLVVPPGETITVTLTGKDDGVHNIQVAGQSASEFVTYDSETITYEFTAPASGSVEYWCVPHKAAGMKGKVVVDGSDPALKQTPAAQEKQEAPALQVALAALAVLALARLCRRVA